MLVGDTSKARKGTSYGRILGVFKLADPTWASERTLSGLSSGEGVLWNVRDPITARVKDRKGGTFTDKVTDPGIADKRLFVQEAEFASVLRHMERPGNTLSSTLRCLWDRGDVQSLTKNSPARTTGSLVSIVGHITVEELLKYLTRTEMANGLANQFLFACVKRSKRLPFGASLWTWSRWRSAWLIGWTGSGSKERPRCTGQGAPVAIGRPCILSCLQASPGWWAR